MQLDTLYTVNTPEGIALTLTPAGFVPRFMAWFIDLLIRFSVGIVLITILGILGYLGDGLILIFLFLLEWWYPVWFEWRHQGQTPGKRLLELYTVQRDGSPVTFAASLLRNLIRFVDFMPFFYGFGVISLLFTRHFQRLGDLAADTLVVYKPHLNAQRALPAVEPLPLPQPLLIQEQQTLLQFAERSRTLTPARADELAQITAETLTQGQPASLTLQRYAVWIAGQHMLSPQQVASS